MNIILSEREGEQLARILRQVVIQAPTQELGVLHGQERFISLGIALKKDEQQALLQAATKLGLKNGLAMVKK